MGRPLGKIQRHVLRSLTQHNNGTWHSGCGWYWDNWSGTKRLMQSLERRGLVDYKPASREYHMGYRAERWTINDKGKEELNNVEPRKVSPLILLENRHGK